MNKYLVVYTLFNQQYSINLYAEDDTMLFAQFRLYAINQHTTDLYPLIVITSATIPY